MIFLKLIGTLFLLLFCSSGFSFSQPNFPGEGEKQIWVSAELEEETYYFSDSTLAVTPGYNHFRLADFIVPNFRLYSLNEIHLARLYISYSVFIHPALDISGIIFPFHSFL